jgi:hypothetical protein
LPGGGHLPIHWELLEWEALHASGEIESLTDDALSFSRRPTALPFSIFSSAVVSLAPDRAQQL